MIAEIASIATECIKNPRRRSVWSVELGRYICPDSDKDTIAMAKAKDVIVSPEMRHKAASHPTINPQFKLVFLTSAFGTLLFLVLCVTMTLLAGKDPAPLTDKVVTTALDLVKIGFGAIVGLLGGKALQAGSTTSSPE